VLSLEDELAKLNNAAKKLQVNISANIKALAGEA